MPINDVCSREVVIVQPGDSALDAAQLMRLHHVGDVVVVQNLGGRRIPVGIVTDRDLVVEIMASELDPTALTVGDIMVQELATVNENASLFEAVELMRAKGVRRLPVTDAIGNLSGILTMDDLLELLAEEMSGLARSVTHEQRRETAIRR
jgi:CBS domain-containing protein